MVWNRKSIPNALILYLKCRRLEELRRFVTHILHLFIEYRAVDCMVLSVVTDMLMTQQKPLVCVRPCDLRSGIKAQGWAAHPLVENRVGSPGVKFYTDRGGATPSVRNLSFCISDLHCRRPDAFYTCSLDLLLKQFLNNFNDITVKQSCLLLIYSKQHKLRWSLENITQLCPNDMKRHLSPADSPR